MTNRPFVVVLLSLTCLTGACALNRAQVKSLRDRDAPRIEFDRPIATTVSALNDIPPRCGPTGNRRVRSEELHVYEVTGRIMRVKRERDHDIHIVLADLEHPRDRMVVELDDPGFRNNAVSPYREMLAAGRRMFDTLLAESGVKQPSELEGAVVRVAGVGFFDLNHFQIGRSRSCIELHPVIAIERVIPKAGALLTPSARRVLRDEVQHLPQSALDGLTHVTSRVARSTGSRPGTSPPIVACA